MSLSLKLVEAVSDNNPVLVEQELSIIMLTILKQKLTECKKMIMTKMMDEMLTGNDEVDEEPQTEPLDEGNIQRMGRIKLVRLRIRNGKIQRRKKMSAVPGYTLRGGRIIRMTPLERRHRKMGARRAKIKRRAEKSRIRIKTIRSLRKRKALVIR